MSESVERTSALAEALQIRFDSYFLADLKCLPEDADPLPPVVSWARTAGVTRLAETTGLDRIGIPTAYVVRPSAQHPCAIISSGKGLSRPYANLSALYECFERWAAEQILPLIVIGSKAHLARQFPHFRIAAPRGLDEDESVAWTLGFDLISKTPCFVPCQVVSFPYFGLRIQSCRVESSTNGMAAGINPCSAIRGALLELVERDALGSWVDSGHSRFDHGRLRGNVAALANRFGTAGVGLSLNSVPSRTGLPVVYGLSIDERLGQSVLFCSGSAAGTTLEQAITNTLTEIAQSRASFISGLREDVSQRICRFQEITFETRERQLARWFSPDFCAPDEPAEPFAGIPSLIDFVDLLGGSLGGAAIACVPLGNHATLHAFRVYCGDAAGPPPGEYP